MTYVLTVIFLASQGTSSFGGIKTREICERAAIVAILKGDAAGLKVSAFCHPEIVSKTPTKSLRSNANDRDKA